MKERSTYIDLLRIVCCFSVVLIHVVATVWYDFDIKSPWWCYATYVDAIVRFCVPVFFMISGALFLSKKEINIKKLYKKNIFNILIILIIWLPIYGVVSYYRLGHKIIDMENIKEIVKGLVDNQFQFWYLFPLLTIYMTLPFLKKISDDKKSLKYYLILYFIFVIMKYTMIPIIGKGYKLRLFGMFQPDLVVGYTGYFLLGYYLYNNEIKKKRRIIIYILSIISIILAGTLTTIISRNIDSRYNIFFGYYMLTTAIPSIGIFLFFKYKISQINFKEKSIKIIKKLSDLTLGIYILHNLIKWSLEDLGITIYILPVPLSVLIITVLVFILSAIITRIIKTIPFIGKKIV